eukprot:4675434-Amphidinium_carterae.1
MHVTLFLSLCLRKLERRHCHIRAYASGWLSRHTIKGKGVCNLEATRPSTKRKFRIFLPISPHKRVSERRRFDEQRVGAVEGRCPFDERCQGIWDAIKNLLKRFVEDVSKSNS